jgi:hypothetical protein
MTSRTGVGTVADCGLGCSRIRPLQVISWQCVVQQLLVQCVPDPLPLYHFSILPSSYLYLYGTLRLYGAASLPPSVCADLAAASSSSSRVQPLLSSSSSSSSLLQGPSECQHCGTYCEWDDESEWEQK